MFRRILQSACTHEKLELRTINYNTPTTTCTRIDHEIICTDCGLVFVDRDNFDRIAGIIKEGAI